MPFSLHVTLQLLEPAPPDPSVALHATVHRHLQHHDPARATQLHDAQVLPISLGWARYAGFGGTLGRDNQTLQFRVHGLDDTWAHPLTQALTPGVMLETPGRLQGRIIGTYLETTPLSELQVTRSTHVTLHFLSPTLLRTGTTYLNEPRADVILHGLLRRARTYTTLPLHEHTWTWAAQTTLDIHRLRPVSITHPKHRHRQIHGFQGSVTLTFPSVLAATALTPVAHLAAWTGVGIKTLYGLGETAVEH